MHDYDDPSAPERQKLEREQMDMQTSIRNLEIQLPAQAPAARANTLAEILRLQKRIGDIRQRLGR